MPWYKADAARSARLKGKKMAIKIENKNMKMVQIVVLGKILSIAKTK
jgi:hypothetical protein